MTKQEMLKILRLLSAMESASLVSKMHCLIICMSS